MRGTGSGAIYSRFCKAQSTLPAVPTMTLQVDDTTGKPVISWSKTANASQYEIYRSTTGADKSYRIIRRTALLNYTDTTAASGTTYYYVVRAIQGTSPNIFRGRFCPAQSIRCAAVPGVPDMALTTDIDTGHIVISWSAAADAAQYEVFRSTDGSSFSGVCRTSALTWTDPTTENGVAYYYKVRGISDSVKGAFCKAQSIAVPGVPSMTLSNDSDTGRNVVSWSSVACATEYEVYRSANGGDYQSVRRTSALTYTDLDTDYGVTYSYKVRAVYSAAPVTVCGAFCPAQNIAIPGVPTMTRSCESVTGRSIIRWNSVSYATEYEVYRSTDGENYQSVLLTTALTYTDLDTSYGVTYFYKVRGVNGSVKGAFCDPKSIVSMAQVVIASGICGDIDSGSHSDVTWELLGDGTLLISGKGKMENCPPIGGGVETTPWCNVLPKIKKAIIRPGVTSIGDWAFSSCSKLNSITIPDSVVSIGLYAFSDCESLSSIKIPASVKTIGFFAFADCTSLTSITIPNGVTTIDNGTFSSCTSLTSIAIPNSVKKIGDWAFNYCDDSLKTVYYGGSKEQWSAITIGDFNYSLKYPEYQSTTILYNQTEPWR